METTDGQDEPGRAACELDSEHAVKRKRKAPKRRRGRPINSRFRPDNDTYKNGERFRAGLESLQIHVVTDNERPNECSAADILQQLGECGDLRAVSISYGRRAGDCRDMAYALMFDLWMSGRADGWRLVHGHFGPRKIEHYWVEYDGWVVDASQGKCLVIPQSKYPTIGSPLETKGGEEVYREVAALAEAEARQRGGL